MDWSGEQGEQKADRQTEARCGVCSCRLLTPGRVRSGRRDKAVFARAAPPTSDPRPQERIRPDGGA